MINSNIETEDQRLSEDTKLHSQRAIALATFLGGPMAAGFLIKENFKTLGKNQLGNNAFFIGIIATVLILVGILSLPEQVSDKIPNFIIPAAYTAIILMLVEKYLGKTFKEHEENNRPFHSIWKAVGVGVIFLAIMLSSIFAYAYFAPDEFDTVKYDNGIAEFNKNEEKALHLFDVMETSKKGDAISYIDNIGLICWEKNLDILSDLDNIEGLNEEFKKQNEILRRYVNLRIETYQLIRKAFSEETDNYDKEIEKLNTQIEKTLNELKAN